MSGLFYAILTDYGEARFASALVTGMPVTFSEMAIGDGAGSLPVPDKTRTGLVNEVYRSVLNRVVIADQAANVIRAEMILPPQTGGFWMREAAIFDEKGECLAVANLPESYKPQLSEGSGKLHAVNLWIAVSNTADVELKTDPSVILATVEEVNRAKAEAKDYTDEVTGSLDINIQKAITDAIAEAKRDFWEEDNPVGTVKFYAQNVNPNDRYPWSEWVYTGENKTIRVGKADGSNVGTAGGSDTVTIQRANLPAEQIGISGATSDKAAQELTTSESGNHTHGGVPSRVNPWEIGGDIRQQFNPANLGETDAAGNHNHTVTVPAHNHTVSGNTENLGSGQSLSVVEAHTLLMCWARVA
ncbi:phage tail protein [Klebsiella variicola]|uniref:phage tail protein n=1 Tax=Klebsiella variicola TaxID=244366 RepID=UPI000CEC2547|nr:phage tail protein [Klebsiella variicola]EKZ6632509.1 phage tail protein [Klebsiella variicola]ROG47811.1 phage tail protein [Klebsiella variicola]